MPFYEKSEDWLHQSSLLLQAYPETTRITTRYHIKPAHRRTKAEKLAAKANPDEPKPAAEKPPRGHLVLKTFDPTSGVALKYKTSKAAEVGRLVQMLGTLGRRMAALPEVKVEDVKQEEDVKVKVEDVAEGMVGVDTVPPVGGAGGGGGQAGGQGKKKKKGRK